MRYNPQAINEFDIDLQPSVNKPLILELTKGDSIDQRENLLLVAPAAQARPILPRR